jgi:zinc transporter ZupT
VRALSKQSQILGVSITLFVLLTIFAGWAWWVVRRNKHRWATWVYAAMLALSAGLFVGIAIEAPKIKRKIFSEN